MKIAIIGTGRMGKALSKCMAEEFDSVILAGRNLEKTKQVASEINHRKLIPLEIEDAISQAELVIPTLWFNDEKEFVSKYREQLEGKIYLNISVHSTKRSMILSSLLEFLLRKPFRLFSPKPTLLLALKTPSGQCSKVLFNLMASRAMF